MPIRRWSSSPATPATSPGRIGVEHVALGSDFDGATVPAELGDVAGVPKVLDALRDAGFADGDIAAIAWDNWRRVLDAWWR